jgi:tripartite-type tricarboxylate transporter receptor subunit TctC
MLGQFIRFVGIAANAMALLVVTAATVPAFAQSWPTRPIKLLVPAVPGGVTDIVARAVAQPMSEALGQSIVVENRAGGSGVIATESVITAAPDGYTLLLVTEGVPMFPSMFKDWKNDPAKSLDYIGLAGRGMFVLVTHPSFPASTLADLIKYAKSSPRPLLYATPGTGQRMVFESLKSLNNFPGDNVAYKGGAQAVGDVVAGHVKVAVLGLAPSLPYFKSGKLTPIAVSGLKRAAALPDVPTVAELGFPGFEFVQWQGLAAPVGTPPEVIARLHQELLRALQLPSTIERLASIGMDNASSAAPRDLTAMVQREADRWPALFKAAGIQPE